MAKLSIDVFDSNKKSVGSVDLPEAFGAPVKKQLLWEVVRSQQASVRAGTASTKKRGDVSGGGKKPWKQKHTGNARHGSTREPQWRHGGNVFGPMPRDYSYEIPKKMRKQAIASALAQRLKEGKLVILDKLELAKPSTKTIVSTLEKLGVSSSTLVITAERNEAVEKSFRNLKSVKLLPVAGLNVRDVLLHQNLVLTRGAVEGVAKRVNA
jgi:large subunit ribosomal protein L4